MTNVNELVNAYFAAWLAVDEAECRHHLEISWSEDGIYQNPKADVLGRQALVQHIAGFHKRLPGTKIILVSGVDHHHDKIHFLWKAINPEGETTLDGRDFGEIGPDGRLRRITRFFDPAPPLAGLPASVYP
jgi:hypothetical protein